MPEIEVALGVLHRRNKILLLQRRGDAHLPFCWSFPGGKLEPGESAAAALSRELQEETGLMPLQTSPFISILWRYHNRIVRLYVFLVGQWHGEAKMQSDEKLRWWPSNNLPINNMPPANAAIVAALRLPAVMAVTPFIAPKEATAFAKTCASCMQEGLKLIYLRGAGMSSTHYHELLQTLQPLCSRHGATILQDARHSAGNDKDLHLPAAQLDMPTAFTGGNWRSASCHGLRQAAKAKQHGANILLVAPVRRTGSHPGRRALGWNKFNTIANRHGIPAYALGAMSCEDLHNSWQNGGRGIALHSHLWQDGNPAALIKSCVEIATARGDVYPPAKS